MVTLTSAAATEIKRAINDKQLPADTSLRIGIKGGGCAGFTYVLDFETQPREFDQIFESNGMRVCVDRKSLLYIDGTEIDFKSELTDRGFKFLNPKADAGCGCGTSFMPKARPLA